MTDERWVDVMAAADLPVDDVMGVEVGGHDIAVYCIGAQVYATDNICTHGQARLSDGFLEGCEIECPLHQGKFDVRDGRPVCEPATEALHSYPVKIDSGRVMVRVDCPRSS